LSVVRTDQTVFIGPTNLILAHVRLFADHGYAESADAQADTSDAATSFALNSSQTLLGTTGVPVSTACRPIPIIRSTVRAEAEPSPDQCCVAQLNSALKYLLNDRVT
jgi:hypothetical protein